MPLEQRSSRDVFHGMTLAVTGKTTEYALKDLEARGVLFVGCRPSLPLCCTLLEGRAAGPAQPIPHSTDLAGSLSLNDVRNGCARCPD